MIRLIKELIKAFYPKCCISCGEIIDEEELLCDICMAEMGKVEISKFCVKCGSSKRDCSCKRRVFYYDGCVAPIFNADKARRLMFTYKFRHREDVADYFAEQMALAVKQGFFGVELDAVCCVPIKLIRRLKRGYNQSRVLALKLAEILDVPYYDNVLGSIRKKRLQHKTTGKDRFKNVNGVYFVKTPIRNKNILLVDDIKTTGATLSECAKQLLATGSNKVYCVTALVTERKGNKNGN